MNHFRQLYNRPIFVVVSDEVPKAKKNIIDSQSDHNDIFFIGTIDEAIDGNLSKIESTGIDLAILSICDHIIVTHGTFGIWSTFLSSDHNTHIVAHSYVKDQPDIEEVLALKNANFTNYIYMTDQ